MQEHLLPSAGRESGNAETHPSFLTQEGKQKFLHQKKTPTLNSSDICISSEVFHISLALPFLTKLSFTSLNHHHHLSQ